MFGVVFCLPLHIQTQLVDLCRGLVAEAPLFQKVMPTGAKFRYLCTSAGAYGWMSDRKGYRYVEEHPLTQRAFPPIPALIAEIATQAAAVCQMALLPQTALINWYGADGTLGLHQDKTEQSAAPVVSISLGDAARFIIGGSERTSPKRHITLYSGDVLVMGGADRWAYHSVKKIIPHTAPSALGMRQAGRINITVRQVYD